MPEENSTADARRSLSNEQKIGFVLLLIFSVLGLTLGVLQMRNTLFAPFALNNSIPSSVKDQINNVDALKYRDTDKDGLSDYDELYRYGTSPYLYDTYGYGLSDKEVVEKNLPLCANAGKDCSDAGTVLSTPSSGVSTSTLGAAPEDFNALIKDPNTIRKLLLENGMDKKTLDKVSDADLLLMVDQLMSSSTLAATTTNP